MKGKKGRVGKKEGWEGRKKGRMGRREGGRMIITKYNNRPTGRHTLVITIGKVLRYRMFLAG